MHPFGWYSLIPPLVAIGFAMVTHRVLLSLFLGVFSGAILVNVVRDHSWNLFNAFGHTLETHLWGAFSDESHLRVLAFTMMMGAMVGVLYRSGGMHGLVELLSPLARGRRGGQLTTWFLGMIVFFDDYANTVLLGHTMRPVTDRLKISREKLAYLVDSTAAPVAGLAVVSTWVATEVSYIQEGYEALNLTVDAYPIFIATIPYRFYVLWALALVFLIGLLNRDYGPMYRAEMDALNGISDNETDSISIDAEMNPIDDTPHRWYNAVIPVVTVIVTVLVLLLMTGLNALVAASKTPTSITELWTQRESDFTLLWNILGNSDSYLALFYGAMSGVVIAVLLAKTQKLLTFSEIAEALWSGTRLMIPGLAVLVLAWALSNITKQEYMDTGGYLSQVLEGSLSPLWMPTIVFLLSAIISFSTGTSWGTMAIVVPQSIVVTYQLLSDGAATPISPDDPILLATIGSVLAGSIFGDHCSPISDTTVLSSQASGCNHLRHVSTQFWYALPVAVLAMICGTLPIAYLDVPIWLLHVIGVAILIGILVFIGKPVQQADGK